MCCQAAYKTAIINRIVNIFITFSFQHLPILGFLFSIHLNFKSLFKEDKFSPRVPLSIKITRQAVVITLIQVGWNERNAGIILSVQDHKNHAITFCLRQTPWKIKSRSKEEIFFPLTESSLFNLQRVGSDLWAKEQCDWLSRLSAAFCESPERVVLRSNTLSVATAFLWVGRLWTGVAKPSNLAFRFPVSKPGPLPLCLPFPLSYRSAAARQRAGGSLLGWGSFTL